MGIVDYDGSSDSGQSHNDGEEAKVKAGASAVEQASSKRLRQDEQAEPIADASKKSR